MHHGPNPGSSGLGICKSDKNILFTVIVIYCVLIFSVCVNVKDRPDSEKLCKIYFPDICSESVQYVKFDLLSHKVAAL